MANLSTYTKGELIKHIFRTGAFTKPAALYLALYVGATEVAGGAYARVAVGPSDATWAAQVGGNGATSNVADVVFPAPTANWGTVTAFKILDAITAGNIIIEGSLATPKTVNNGDPAPKFPATVLLGTFA